MVGRRAFRTLFLGKRPILRGNVQEGRYFPDLNWVNSSVFFLDFVGEMWREFEPSTFDAILSTGAGSFAKLQYRKIRTELGNLSRNVSDIHLEVALVYCRASNFVCQSDKFESNRVCNMLRHQTCNMNKYL